MGFIKLVMSRVMGFEGEPVYINTAHIEAVRADDKDGTVVFVVGDNNAKYFVKESPDAIMAMIELQERGRGV